VGFQKHWWTPELDELKNPEMPFIDRLCLEGCTKQLKRNKAAGSDGIINEHILYGNKDLYVHLFVV